MNRRVESSSPRASPRSNRSPRGDEGLRAKEESALIEVMSSEGGSSSGTSRESSLPSGPPSSSIASLPLVVAPADRKSKVRRRVGGKLQPAVTARPMFQSPSRRRRQLYQQIENFDRAVNTPPRQRRSRKNSSSSLDEASLRGTRTGGDNDPRINPFKLPRNIKPEVASLEQELPPAMRQRFLAVAPHGTSSIAGGPGGGPHQSHVHVPAPPKAAQPSLKSNNHHPGTNHSPAGHHPHHHPHQPPPSTELGIPPPPPDHHHVPSKLIAGRSYYGGVYYVPGMPQQLDRKLTKMFQGKLDLGHGRSAYGGKVGSTSATPAKPNRPGDLALRAFHEEEDEDEWW